MPKHYTPHNTLVRHHTITLLIMNSIMLTIILLIMNSITAHIIHFIMGSHTLHHYKLYNQFCTNYMWVDCVIRIGPRTFIVQSVSPPY